MKTMNVKWMICLVLILSSVLTYSQSQGNQKDDEDVVSSIASYPSDVRGAILSVSQYPRKIVKLERVQGRTSQSFQDLISDYSREDQKKYYEISRYPDLIHQLVEDNPKSLDQIKPALSTYPKEVADAVGDLYPKRLSDLRAIDKEYQSSQKSLDKITEDLPNDVQADFKKVVSKPDVMNLLTEHIDQVVKLGEAYKDDPKGTKAKLDELNAQITAQNQKDLDDYKNKVANDPKMQDEMKKSAQDFTSSNGQNQPTVVNNYYGGYYGSYAYPYPYWFGYPYWYSYPMWYPMPYYYYTGFYFGLGGSVVVVGMPSRVYSSWMFNYGYHRYPRYYGYYGGYYSSHRTFVTNLNVYRGFNTTINNNFSRVSRTQINRDVNVYQGGRIQRNNAGFNGNNSFHSRINSAPNHFRNSVSQPNNFNRQSFDNFRSNQFHQQGWGNVRGGTFGGTTRMSGGFGGGGGGHGGGGHGRR